MKETKKEKYTELQPSEGMWLTQKEAKDEERIFSKSIALAEGSTADVWNEWSDSEKEKFEAELAEKMSVMSDEGMGSPE